MIDDPTIQPQVPLPEDQGPTIPPASIAEVVSGRHTVDDIFNALLEHHELQMQAVNFLLGKIAELDRALVMQNAGHQHAFDRITTAIKGLNDSLNPPPASPPPDAVGGHRMGGKE